MLNAKYHEQEAAIIAEAGRSARSPSPPTWPAAVPTSCWAATSRVHRRCGLRKRGLDPVDDAGDTKAAWHEEHRRSSGQRRRGSPRPCARAGLYVLGTERHESRRIDNQLRGRSGRQGDPGESRFYLSLGDELMRRFNGAAPEMASADPLNLPDDVPIEARWSPGHQERADAGRAAELRGPQERPQVRRGDEPAAQGHLRRTPHHPRRRGSRRRGAADDRRRRQRLRRRRHRRGLRRGLGPRRTMAPCGPCTRSTSIPTWSSAPTSTGARRLTPEELRDALLDDAHKAYAARRPRSTRSPARARCVNSSAASCST